MARNPDLTRQRLLDTAAQEFSAHGLAGSRVDRIAAAAGVNKERIYQYFGNKTGLFTAVLEARLAEVTGANTPIGVGEPAILNYAFALAQSHAQDQTLARLLHWEALELPQPVALEARRRQCLTKVDALMAAAPSLDREAATSLLYEILIVVNSTAVLTNLAASILPGGGALIPATQCSLRWCDGIWPGRQSALHEQRFVATERINRDAHTPHSGAGPHSAGYS
ncbi:TetR/AcrR family transcriptional regulator [Leucobacter insecticola]|uniref:TetR/AcrR family transcriptional regulator n=1 Tax=Leucobacter insecticola TaxID=2714934 RepID=A0A6G8FGE7_9MICO|nr:TetR/AcrR family transcriptional regulator [Leucobacter insecticola]QIM15329.1 TetR/AcrR family transcriptional regulator [Leucobacter insecticola]